MANNTTLSNSDIEAMLGLLRQKEKQAFREGGHRSVLGAGLVGFTFRIREVSLSVKEARGDSDDSEILRACGRNEKERQRKETVALERKNVSFWMWA